MEIRYSKYCTYFSISSSNFDSLPRVWPVPYQMIMIIVICSTPSGAKLSLVPQALSSSSLLSYICMLLGGGRPGPGDKAEPSFLRSSCVYLPTHVTGLSPTTLTDSELTIKPPILNSLPSVYISMKQTASYVCDWRPNPYDKHITVACWHMQWSFIWCLPVDLPGWPRHMTNTRHSIW